MFNGVKMGIKAPTENAMFVIMTWTRTTYLRWRIHVFPHKYVRRRSPQIVSIWGRSGLVVIGNRQSDFLLVTPPCPDLPMIFRIPPFKCTTLIDAA